MDHEILQTLSLLLDEKLQPIKEDITSLKEDVNSLKEDVNNLKEDVNSLKEDVNSIKIQQDENTKLLRALVHNSEVNKAEHDKMYNEIIKLSGKVENMRKDLCTVEIVTARNMENIAQLKVAK